MADDSPPTETEQEIMEATYRALHSHGYANLTMQAIADEFDKTKGVLHYHYDTKQELLVAFLEYLLDAFYDDLEEELADGPAAPRHRLEALIEMLLFGREHDLAAAGFDHWGLTQVMLEIRTAAPHEPAFQDQLTRNFDAIESLMAQIIAEGIENGDFASVDPEQTATMVVSLINGARIYQVTLNRDDVAADVYAVLQAGLEAWLYAPAQATNR